MTAPAEHGVNVALLRDVLTYITEHPEEHNQRHWGVRTACGTAYCLAGHALIMSDAEFTWVDAEADIGAEAQVADTMETGEPIAEAAADLLGLDAAAATDLFSPSNTLGDLWRLAGRLTNGEIQRPAVTS